MPLDAEVRQSGAIVFGLVMALRSALFATAAFVLFPAVAMAQSGSYSLVLVLMWAKRLVLKKATA